VGDAAMSVKKQNRNLENHGKEAYYLSRFYMLLAFLLFRCFLSYSSLFLSSHIHADPLTCRPSSFLLLSSALVLLSRHTKKLLLARPSRPCDCLF